MDMDSKIVSVGDTIYAAVIVDVPVTGLEFTIEVKMINILRKIKFLLGMRD